MSKEVKKDIIISITNLPPAAYDTMSDYVQIVMADLMRTMAKYRHLLTEDSKINCTYKTSQLIEKQ